MTSHLLFAGRHVMRRRESEALKVECAEVLYECANQGFASAHDAEEDANGVRGGISAGMGLKWPSSFERNVPWWVAARQRGGTGGRAPNATL